MLDNAQTNTRNRKIAGTMLFLTGVLAFMGIITAETLYPGYSTAHNTISDLGGSLPPNSVIVEPSATIFDTTMIISGFLILGSAYFIQYAFRDIIVSAFLGLFGIGVLGVGIFNGSYGDIHGIFALLTFVAGGIAAIVSYRIEKAPLSYFSVVLGGVALLDLLLYYLMGEASPFAVMGLGGLERWIAYPILLWVTGFGGYLIGSSES